MERAKNITRWRLLLGKESEKNFEECTGFTGILSEEEAMIEAALDAIYNENSTFLNGVQNGGKKGASAPKVSKWLGDIRSLFPPDLVQIIQRDAIERKNMKELLMEPEVLANTAPDIELACTLLTLKNQVPERAKQAVREYISAIVEKINDSLKEQIIRAVTAALNRHNHCQRGTASSIDFTYTIRKNLRNYNQDLKTIIPEKIYFFDHKTKANSWNIILDIDQSGSMGESILYSSVMGCILAKMSSLRTRIVAFDTNIIDLTELYEDPVDLLYGIQMGGGTDIYKSVCYCEQFIEQPDKTIFFLISDLEEGGSHGALIRKMQYLKDSQVTVICLLAVSHDGKPYYNETLAKTFASMGIPSFASAPQLLPELLEKALKGESVDYLAKKKV